MSNKRSNDLKKYEDFVARVLNESFGQKVNQEALQGAAKKVAKIIEDSSVKSQTPLAKPHHAVCRP